MPENRHKRFRIDIKAEDAEYFEKIAEETGVPTTTVLRIVVTDAARRKFAFRPEDRPA